MVSHNSCLLYWLQTENSFPVTTIIAAPKGNRGLIDEIHGQDHQRLKYRETSDSEPAVAMEKSEVGELIGIASDAIKNLLKLVFLVRQTTEHCQFAHAREHEFKPLLDSLDTNHVEERFTKLRNPESQWLLQRLGRAIALRRRVLQYIQDRKSQTGDSLAGTLHGLPATVEALEISAEASTLGGSRLEVDVIQGSKATSEEVDSAPTMTSQDNNAPHLPLLSEIKMMNQHEGSFKCPLCDTFVSIDSEQDWNRHVHDDLKSYVCCVGQDGQCESQMFGNEAAWFDHELKYHRRQWTCVICRGGLFRTSKETSDHLTGIHPEYQFSEAALSALIFAGQRPVDVIPAKDCPFCDDWHLQLLRSQSGANRGKPASMRTQNGDIVVPTIMFRQHVALHLQQLALFTIPRGALDSTELTRQSNGTQEPRSSRRSLVSAARGFESPTPRSISYSNEEEDLVKVNNRAPVLRVISSSSFPEGEQELDSENLSSIDAKGKQVDMNRQVSELSPEPEHGDVSTMDEPKSPKRPWKRRSKPAKSARDNKNRRGQLELWSCVSLSFHRPN